MKKILLITIGFVALFVVACGNTANKESDNIQQVVKQEKKERSFQLPEVPAMLDTLEARAAFVARHYWDHFDFADTAYIHLPDITEQAIVNFMDLMDHVPQDVAELSISILYGKAASHSPMLWHFWETMSRYWHDPNSPMKNEDKFILMCRSSSSRGSGVEASSRVCTNFGREESARDGGYGFCLYIGIG